MKNQKIDTIIQSVDRIKNSLDQALILLSQTGTVTINYTSYYDDFNKVYTLLNSLKCKDENA